MSSWQLGEHEVLVDYFHEPKLRQFAWSVVRNNGRLEAVAWIDGATERLHRYVWKLSSGPIPQGMLVDHINRNSLDCRIHNLRLATPSQNQANQGTRTEGKTSQFRGVRRRGSRWVAQLQVNGRRLHLGSFHSESAAARAYDSAARRYYGEFANTNLHED